MFSLLQILFNCQRLTISVEFLKKINEKNWKKKTLIFF